MELKPLNTKQALKLYGMLRPHVKIEGLKERKLLPIAKEIIDSIVEKGVHQVYVDMVVLMSGLTINDLKEMKAPEVLDIFARGLVANDFIGLILFGDRMGLNG